MSSRVLLFSLDKIIYVVYYWFVKYLKASEVAIKLNVKHVTVRAWLSKGLFPNAKLEETIAGSIWLIPQSDIDNFQKPTNGRPKKSEK